MGTLSSAEDHSPPEGRNPVWFILVSPAPGSELPASPSLAAGGREFAGLTSLFILMNRQW